MTVDPKDKAKQLAWAFAYKADPFHDGDLPGKTGIECALICLEEIISTLNGLFDDGTKDVHQSLNTPVRLYRDVINPKLKYWEEVKQELLKL